MNVDALLVWCCTHIECDACRAVGGVYVRATDSFICKTDRELIARLQPGLLPEE